MATTDKEIAIPHEAAIRVRNNFEALQKQQAAINNFVEGIAAGLGVPGGWQLDIDRMVWVAPQADMQAEQSTEQ